jgi:hypothetical protein
MRAEPPTPPRTRLANVATALAVVLCVVLAVIWTRPADAPVVPAPAPLADSHAAARDAAAWLDEVDEPGVEADPPSESDRDSEADSVEGGVLWRDRAGERGAQERQPGRARRAERRGEERGGRQGAKRSRRARAEGRERARRGRRTGGHTNAERVGGAGKPIPAAPPAGSVPRRQGPPAAAPGPGTGSSAPEFAIG